MTWCPGDTPVRRPGVYPYSGGLVAGAVADLTEARTDNNMADGPGGRFVVVVDELFTRLNECRRRAPVVAGFQDVRRAVVRGFSSAIFARTQPDRIDMYRACSQVRCTTALGRDPAVPHARILTACRLMTNAASRLSAISLSMTSTGGMWPVASTCVVECRPSGGSHGDRTFPVHSAASDSTSTPSAALHATVISASASPATILWIGTAVGLDEPDGRVGGTDETWSDRPEVQGQLPVR